MLKKIAKNAVPANVILVNEAVQKNKNGSSMPEDTFVREYKKKTRTLGVTVGAQQNKF